MRSTKKNRNVRRPVSKSLLSAALAVGAVGWAADTFAAKKPAADRGSKPAPNLAPLPKVAADKSSSQIKSLRDEIQAATDPAKQSDLRVQLIDAYMAAGRPIEAMQDIVTWLKFNEASPQREKVTLTLIAALRQSGDWDGAASTSRAFLRDFAKSQNRKAVLLGLVDIARNGQANPGSEAFALNELLALEPNAADTPKLMLRLGKVREQAGDLAGAVGTLQKFAEKYPGDPDADMAGWRAVWLTHDRLRRTGEALPAAQAHLKKFPNRPSVSQDWVFVAELARAVEKWPDAISAAQTALNADAKNRSAATIMVDVSREHATIDELLKVVQVIERSFPSQNLVLDARLNLIRRQIEQKKVDANAAFGELSRLLEKKYRTADVCGLLEAAADQFGGADKSKGRGLVIKLYGEEIPKLKAGDVRAELAIRLAAAYRADGKIAESQKVLETELKENPVNRKELTVDYLMPLAKAQQEEINSKKRTKFELEPAVRQLADLVRPHAYMIELRRGMDEVNVELQRWKNKDAANMIRQQVQELGAAELSALVETAITECQRDHNRAADALVLIEQKFKDKPGIFDVTAKAAQSTFDRCREEQRAKLLPYIAARAEKHPADLETNLGAGEAFRRLGKFKESVKYFERVAAAELTPQSAPHIGAALGALMDMEAYEFKSADALAKVGALTQRFEKVAPLLGNRERQERYRQLAQIYGRQKDTGAQQVEWLRKAVAVGMTDASFEAVRNLIQLLPAREAQETGKKLLADPANDRWYPQIALTVAHRVAMEEKDVSAAIPLLHTAQEKRLYGFRLDWDDQGLLRDIVNAAIEVNDPRRTLDAKRKALLADFKPVTPEQIESLLTVARQWMTSQQLQEAAREAIRVRGAAKDCQGQLEIFAQCMARTRANDQYHWEGNMAIIREELSRGNDGTASTMLRVLLKHNAQYNEQARRQARAMLVQVFSRFGEDLLAVADKSPIAPLLQGAGYYRLGEEKQAWELYQANAELFAQRIDEVPAEYVLFVGNELATGGDTDRDTAEQLLRTWLLRKDKDANLDPAIRAAVSLKLADVFYFGKRFDVARAEYQSVRDKFPDSRQAIEAYFRIGESFMYQKNYAEAQKVFDVLRKNKDSETAIRGTFMSGVLQYAQGNRDDARESFKTLLDLSPSEDLASKALYQLALIYGDDNRFREMLDMLEAIGRIGREGKRWHTPGQNLTIMIHDPDMAVVQDATTVPVVVTTTNGDKEVVYLSAGSAGRGIYLTELPTVLGAPHPGDRTLQLLGNDVISYDYPDDFKARFRYVPPPQGNIRVASDATFRSQATKIVDEDKKTVAERAATATKIERGAADQHEFRNASEIKPGNPIYLRVIDPDRAVSTGVDRIEVNLQATSGDSVRAFVAETSPCSGVFEGSVKTAERPPETIASDSFINKPAALACDKDETSAWESQHDGQSGKWIAADLKEVQSVKSFKYSVPDAAKNAPKQYTLETSMNGSMWEPVYSTEKNRIAHDLTLNYGQMRATRYGLSQVKQAIGATKMPTNLAEFMALVANPKLPEGEAQTMASLTLPAFKSDPEGDVYVMTGYLYAGTAAKNNYMIRGQHNAVAFVVDGRIIRAKPEEWSRGVAVDLGPGWHRLAVFIAATGESKDAPRGLAYMPATGGGAKGGEPLTALPIPAGRDAGMPAPGAYTVPAAPKVATEGTITSFDLGSIPARFVRLNIESYEGEYVAVADVRVEGDGGKVLLPTDMDVMKLADDDILQVSPGDDITAVYVDQINTKTPGEARILVNKMRVTYYNGSVRAIVYDVKSGAGGVTRTAKDLYRIDPGDRIIAQITDYDEDTTAEPDKVKFTIRTDSGAKLELEAAETGPTTGVFTKEIDTGAGEGKLAVKPGEQVYIIYKDKLNTIPGSATDRLASVEAVKPTDGSMSILQTRLPQAAADSTARPMPIYLPAKAGEPARVVLGVPLTIEVIDEDLAKDSYSTAEVEVKTSAGAKLIVPLEISEACRAGGPRGVGETAVKQGRFVGQVLLVLGKPNADGKYTEAVNLEQARGLVGAWRYQAAGAEGTVAAPVLPILGADTITATYMDKRNTTGKERTVTSDARMVTDATLTVMDRGFENPISLIHLGEKLYIRVEDGDRDTTAEMDEITVNVTSKLGDKLAFKLKETLGHSGVFTGELPVSIAEKADPANDKLETTFGDEITITYVDENNSAGASSAEQKQTVSVAIGTDAKLLAFTKQFGDQEMAVETQFKLAECYFELFKSHNSLKAEAEAKQALEAGRSILASVRDNYRGSAYEARVLYLLGSFHQELKEYDRAVDAFATVVRVYSNSTLSPDAQYKLGQCYEEKGEMEQACEEYVRLAYTYPENPLIAKCMVRLSDYFYKSAKFAVAANICGQFIEQYGEHEWAPKIAFRQGQCYYKAAEAAAKEAGATAVASKGGGKGGPAGNEYVQAAKAFDLLVERYTESDLRPEAMFWAGQSYHKAGDFPTAYRRYKRTTWDFPDTDAARYARGQLTLPEIAAAERQEK